MLKCDNYWHNRLKDRLIPDQDWAFYEEKIDKEMERLYPMLKRRDDLVTMTQKNGQLLSNFYREVEKQAQECKLAEMNEESWIGHLVIQNMADKALKKEILLRQTLDKDGMMKIIKADKSYYMQRDNMDSKGMQEGRCNKLKQRRFMGRNIVFRVWKARTLCQRLP